MNLPNRNTLHCALRIFRPFPVTMCSEKLTNFRLFVQMFEFSFPVGRFSAYKADQRLSRRVAWHFFVGYDLK